MKTPSNRLRRFDISASIGGGNWVLEMNASIGGGLKAG
jgi:hypothetical protein